MKQMPGFVGQRYFSIMGSYTSLHFRQLPLNRQPPHPQLLLFPHSSSVLQQCLLLQDLECWLTSDFRDLQC